MKARALANLKGRKRNGIRAHTGMITWNQKERMTKISPLTHKIRALN